MLEKLGKKMFKKTCVAILRKNGRDASFMTEDFFNELWELSKQGKEEEIKKKIAEKLGIEDY